MKIFFNSTFISKESLKDTNVNYPIKLEYYKIINEDEILNSKYPKFGISIVKTEYIEKNINVEYKTIKYLSNDEKKIEEILKVFKENEVTPISAADIICDLSKKIVIE